MLFMISLNVFRLTLDHVLFQILIQGSANDLRFTKYILQNASLLHDMKISVTTHGMLLGKS